MTKTLTGAELSPAPTSTLIERRSVVRTAAWAVPTIAAAASVPALATSGVAKEVDAATTIRITGTNESSLRSRTGKGKLWECGADQRVYAVATFSNNGPDEIPAGSLIAVTYISKFTREGGSGEVDVLGDFQIHRKPEGYSLTATADTFEKGEGDGEGVRVVKNFVVDQAIPAGGSFDLGFSTKVLKVSAGDIFGKSSKTFFSYSHYTFKTGYRSRITASPGGPTETTLSNNSDLDRFSIVYILKAKWGKKKKHYTSRRNCW